MFFFIAGIQPKTVTLDETPRMCPACGLYQARLKRVDHYLSLFFIPLFPVKKGGPFVQCQRCGSVFSESGEAWGGTRTGDRTCPGCGRPVEPGFRFCPSCGRRL
jgi:hypothetical protein